jgi:hypothetical protein
MLQVSTKLSRFGAIHPVLSTKLSREWESLKYNDLSDTKALKCEDFQR